MRASNALSGSRFGASVTGLYRLCGLVCRPQLYGDLAAGLGPFGQGLAAVAASSGRTHVLGRRRARHVLDAAPRAPPARQERAANGAGRRGRRRAVAKTTARWPAAGEAAQSFRLARRAALASSRRMA